MKCFDLCFQVKVIVNLKGRENEFRNMAMELIRRFQNDVGEVIHEVFLFPPFINIKYAMFKVERVIKII